MAEWAKRAGRLVFSDIETFHEENFVTFVNLSVFWHSQGSWRTFYLYKGAGRILTRTKAATNGLHYTGNALNLLVILGLVPGSQPIEDPWVAEVRRRRLWACYLTYCHNSESLSRFPVAGMEDLELPWPEADFDSKISQRPGVTLRSGGCSGGIYSRMIRAMTLWYSSNHTAFSTSHSPTLQVPSGYFHQNPRSGSQSQGGWNSCLGWGTIRVVAGHAGRNAIDPIHDRESTQEFTPEYHVGQCRLPSIPLRVTFVHRATVLLGRR